MFKSGLKRILCGLAICGLAFAVGTLRAQSATAVPQLDLDHVRGTWYEIAYLPTKGEKDCGRNASQLIAFGNGKNTLQFVDSCTGKHGDTDLINMNATQDKSRDGKLKSKHLLIFSRHYYVLAIAPDDAWMLLGSPNHKELWVLSKTQTMAPDVLSQVEAKAAGQGFDTSKLLTMPQDPQPTV